LKINFIIRVKGSVKVFYRGRWIKLNTIGFVGNARRRNLGRLYYCEKSPRRLWITMSRARNKKGKIYLLQDDRSLFVALSPSTKLNLEASLSNMS